MAKCLNCGANVDGMKFCGECGARVPQDKECPACHARMPLATKFCSECGYNFTGTCGATAAVEKPDECASDSGQDNGGCSTAAGSGSSLPVRCSMSLQSAGDDVEAVVRELCMHFKRTPEEARSIAKRAPIPLHLDIARVDAERIADALRRVGATVELFDHDLGTQTQGDCTVVLQSVPSSLGIPARAVLGAEIAKLLGCMPANGFKMLNNLPLTLAENVSREEAEEIVATFEQRKCVVEIV